jgi:hypothetical protein
MKLLVCLEGQVAGTLNATGARTHLTYSDSWLSINGAYPLSQSLPLTPEPLTGAPVINFPLSVKEEFGKNTMAPDVMTRLVDGLVAQCRATARTAGAVVNGRVLGAK